MIISNDQFINMKNSSVLLDNSKSKILELKRAILDGVNSPKVKDFDFEKNLKNLKESKKKNGNNNL